MSDTFTDQIARAVGDPGSLLPRLADETVTRWSTRAVLTVLADGPQLPPLEKSCPDCPTDDDRDAARDAWNAWHDAESLAFQAWTAEREARGNVNAWDPDLWTRTDEYAALVARQPEELPSVGCFECNYTGVQPTEAGRELLAFLARHGKG